MMVSRNLLLVAACGIMSFTLSGCPTAPDYKKGGSGSTASTDGDAPEGLEQFTAPTLEELDAKAEWESQPVINIMDRYNELLAKHPQTETAEAALQLKNTSTADNEKILNALSRAPAAEKDANFDAEINRHLNGDINSTNPILASSTSDNDVNSLTGIGFFSFDWNMEPFAPSETVVSWQTSKDLLYDKVVIRDDLVWSDGTPITAYDVEFSFQTIMNPDVPVPAVRTGTDKLRWVKAYDKHTFVIFHKEALATNVWNCNFPIIPKHIYEKSVKEDASLVTTSYHQKQEQNPVVGGQYKILRRAKGQEIVLERREDWYMKDGKQIREKPYYRLIRFRVMEDRNTARLALNDGLLDEMALQPREWVEQTGDDKFYRLNTKVRGVEWVYFYFGWNIKTPYFSDVRVRKAMSYSVNYDQILNKLCYGLYEQATGEFPEGNWAAPLKPRTPYKQDLKKAQELLKEAGWADTDGDGVLDKTINGSKVKFEFSIMCSNDQSRVDICSSLRESLSQIGIVCNVKPTEFTVMQQLAQDRKFQAMFGGWGTGTDPATTENLWKTGESRNYTNFSNALVDELFAKALKELDQEKRAEVYRKIDEILWEEQPYTWLYYRSSFYAFNKKLRGYMFSPRGPYHYSPGFGSIWSVATP